MLSKRTKRGKVSGRSRSWWVYIGKCVALAYKMAAGWTEGS